MNNTYYFYFLLLFSCVTSCQFLASDTSIKYLEIQKENNNLINSVEKNLDQIIISFENRDTLRIQEDEIESFSYDSTKWEAQFIFSNSKKINVPAIGVLNNKKIVLNPFKRAPLAAQITFQTPFETGVSIRVMGQKGEIEITKEFPDPKITHQIPILGLFPNRVNKIELTFINNERFKSFKEIFEVETDSVFMGTPPIPIGDLTITVKKKGLYEPGFIYTNDNVKVDHYVWDENGQLRGHYLGGGKLFYRVANGNFITFSGIRTGLELGKLGQLVNRFSLPTEYSHVHHDIYEMPTGNLLLTVVKKSATVFIDGEELPSTEDFIIEIDRKTGALIKEWDLRQILDVSRVDKARMPTYFWDWFHCNSVVYDEKDKSIILSGTKQGFVKIGYDDKKLKWIMAPNINWGKAGPKGDISWNPEEHLLTAVNSQNIPYRMEVQKGLELPGKNEEPFYWCYGNHNALIIPSNDSLLHILIFNNRATTVYHPQNYANNGLVNGEKSFMIEYIIDEEKMTVNQKKAYDHDKYSFARSGVDIGRSTGNYIMLGEGEQSKLSEFTRDGNLVFQATIDASHKGVGFYRMVKYPSLY